MAASTDALGALHDMVATALSLALKGQELPGYTDEDGVEQPPTILPPSAAIIQAATKFLKDNEITCVASDDNKLGQLQQDMQARREKRKASRVDLIAATEQTQFLTGLPN